VVNIRMAGRTTSSHVRTETTQCHDKRDIQGKSESTHIQTETVSSRYYYSLPCKFDCCPGPAADAEQRSCSLEIIGTHEQTLLLLTSRAPRIRLFTTYGTRSLLERGFQSINDVQTSGQLSQTCSVCCTLGRGCHL